MYNPSDFVITDTVVLHDLIQTHPLGTLISHTERGLDAIPLPFLFKSEIGAHGLLQAHVARANPVWRELVDGDKVLVVFYGAQGYISPNGYPSKHETHRQVPTWNYQTVHAHGIIRIRDDAQFARSVVARLTREHEGRTQGQKAWRMGEAPADYIDELLLRIVGIEIEITQLSGKYKLCQDETLADRGGAAN